MTDLLSPSDIAAIRAPSAQSSWLPPHAYVDPGFFELEKDRVLGTSWLAVGRVDQVADVGDYFTMDLFGEPIIITRDKGGTVRALSNVCPHRWMRVVGHEPDAPVPFRSDAAGNTKVLQCPYHLWSFDLAGRMTGAPGMDEAEDFDRADWCLPELRCELWAGFVFVNFDPDAAPLGPQLRDLDGLVERFELERLRMTGEPMEYVADWNWKMSVEAGSESYHHLALHRDLLEDALPAAMSDIEASTGPWCLYRNPTADGSEIIDQFPCPEGLDERDRTSLTLLTIFPYTMLFMLPGYTAYLQVVPQTFDRHLLRFFPLVHPNVDQHPDPEGYVAGVRATLDAVHQQDMVAGRHMWAGVQSRFARPGRRSHLEEQLWRFHNWLLDRLGC